MKEIRDKERNVRAREDKLFRRRSAPFKNQRFVLDILGPELDEVGKDALILVDRAEARFIGSVFPRLWKVFSGIV